MLCFCTPSLTFTVCSASLAVASSFVVAQSTGDADTIATATAAASNQAAAANTDAAAQALAQTAIQSRTQGVTDTFAASQVPRLMIACRSFECLTCTAIQELLILQRAL